MSPRCPGRAAARVPLASTQTSEASLPATRCSVLLEQARHAHLQAAGEAADDAHAELALPPLKKPDLCPVKPCTLREHLLRQAGPLPQRPHPGAERPDELPVVFTASHPLTVLLRYGSVDYGSVVPREVFMTQRRRSSPSPHRCRQGWTILGLAPVGLPGAKFLTHARHGLALHP